jgi:hypothetical protein
MRAVRARARAHQNLEFWIFLKAKKKSYKKNVNRKIQMVKNI